jgi:tRNA(Ile2)-agmatinylcytidine synthase
MWIGIDDTDSPQGGCTTHVLTELLALAARRGIDLLGDPRLVRLNPNIPWKTRGNAALSARFGRGVGPRRRVGQVAGRTVWSYARGAALPPTVGEAFAAAAWETVQRLAPDVPGTDPALVAVRRSLDPELYWRAVRSVVRVDAVDGLLAAHQASVFVRGDRRGVVGAAAAIAWPGRRATWELIAYRPLDRQSADRAVDRASVQRAQARFPALFLCEDARTRRLLIAPHTPCPILFGLRSRIPGILPRAARAIRSEPVDRWVVFRTNQATGDHLVRRSIADVGAYESAILDVGLVSPPLSLAGGHVRLEVGDGTGARLSCFVFEPSKTLPGIARSLVAGDALRLWGSRAADPIFRVEGITVRHLRPRPDARAAPVCATCRRRAGSIGRGRGFRCPECRRRFPLEAAQWRGAPSRLRVGTYHPTPSARRHLAPLAPG